MLTLTIIAGVVVAVLALGALYNFNQHTMSRYGHRFLAWGPLLLGAAALWAAFVGAVMAQKSGDPLPALVGGIAASALLAMLVVRNVRRTNLALGLAGSLAQAVICVVIAAAAPVIAVVWGGFALLRGGRSAGAGTATADAPFTHYAATGPYHGNGNRHVFPPSVRIP